MSLGFPPVSPTLKHASSKFVQFKYCLAGRVACGSNISHMVGCLSFDAQFAASKLLRMMKRCGTQSLIVLNLRVRIKTANPPSITVASIAVASKSAATLYTQNLPEHTSKLEETYEAEGGQVSRRRHQQFRVVQRNAHPLEARLEDGTRQLRLLPNEQRFYLQRGKGDDERRPFLGSPVNYASDLCTAI